MKKYTLKMTNITEVKEDLNKWRDKSYSTFRCLDVNATHFVLLIQHIATKIPREFFLVVVVGRN